MIILLLALVFAIQLPAVQTGLARYVSGRLSSATEGTVKVGAIRLHPFNAITAKDIVVIDDNPAPDLYGRGCGIIDTLASVGSLSVNLDPRSLLRKGAILVSRADIKDLNFQFVIEPGNGKGGSNLTRIFNLYGGSGDSSMPLDSLFTIGRLNVKNGRYRMVNLCENMSNPGHGINYEDLDMRFNLAAHNISMHGGRVHAVVDELDAVEKSGYEILSAGGSVAAGQGHVNIKNFRLADGVGSDLRFPRFDMNYEGNPSAWSNFLREVEFDAATARGSHLVFGSIGYFSGGTFWGTPLAVDITSLKIKGPISGFRVSDAVLSATGTDVSCTVNGTYIGIPKTADMRVDATLSDVRFSTGGLTRLLADLGARADLRSIAPGVTFTVDGTASGLLSDLKADLSVASGIGALQLNAAARNAVASGKPLEFKANADADGLDLGKLLGVEALGRSDFRALVSGVLGHTPHITVENLSVPSLSVLGYEYHDLELEGYMHGSNAVAAFRSADPNATVDLAANIDWKEKKGHIDAELTEFDLAATGLDRRGGKSLVSCSISGEQDLGSSEPAKLNLVNVVLTSDAGSFEIGDIYAQARTDGDALALVLNSEVIDAKYNGTSDFGTLVSALRSNTVNKYIPAFFDPHPSDEPAAAIATDCSLSATFHDTEGLLAFLLPGLKIGSGTALNVDAGSDGSILGYVSAPSVEWNGMSATGLDLAAGNLGGSLDCTVGATFLNLGGFTLDKAQVSATALDDRLGLSVNYDNAPLLEGGGDLDIDAAFSRSVRDSLRIDLSTLPSQLTIKGDDWNLGRSGIAICGGRIWTDNLRLWCDDQSITLSGGVRPAGTDTLQVKFHELDMALVNAFTGDALGLEGTLNGDATLVSPVSSQLGLSAALDLSSLAISGTRAGDISLTSKWDDDAKAIAIDLSGMLDGVKGLDVSGTYGTSDGRIDARAAFDGFDVGLAAPFVKSIMPEIGGRLTGSVTASGTPSDLRLASDGLSLGSVRFLVGYTGVAYTLDGTLGVQDNIVSFNNINVKDDFDGSGLIRGSLDLGKLVSPTLDASLDMRSLKAINIPFGESEIGIYGDLAVSGNGRVKGPFNNLDIDAAILTSGPGSVNVPISSSVAASGSDLLTFTAPGGPDDGTSAAASPARTRSGSSRMSVHARAMIRPEVIANIEIDKDSGHVLTAGGTGDVVFDYVSNAQNSIQIKGEYLIDNGKYLLNIPGIVSKEFDIREGSSLKFNGDPLESALDITAVHNVKTSLSTLVADSTAVSTRRTVECGLGISGKLRSPEVSFSIDVPDLDPSTKMQVDAALSTTDKVQKQFVALLLFGTFLPEENTGIVNRTNMIYSNVGEIVAGQLNNILQKLDIPIDFGFGYQQDNVGTDIFDVAVSTQLFNNRLVVGGSVGNRKYSTSKSAYGDIVGDLDMELKLDRSGELRFKLFSHSADEYTSSLDYSQRNGMGFSYQKEYDRTREFIRQLFSPRRKRPRDGASGPPPGSGGMAVRQKETKIIEIR